MAMAKAERMVSIQSTAGSESRAALVQAFKEKYGLNIEMVAGNGSEMAQKLLRERAAGIYAVDINVVGNTTPITDLKPKQALDPIEPLIILPEAKDPQAWWGGGLQWVDKEHMELATLGQPEPAITINTNLVQSGEVKSYKDLLNPKWKGKIALRDPSAVGGGGKWFSVAIQSGMLNLDYMRQLAKQDPVVVRDGRLQAEWLAQGKYAIGVATQGSVIEPMMQLKVPLLQLVPEEGTYLASGSTCLALVNRAPHPNATKIFVNWFLTKDGQTTLSKAMGSQSYRLDVPTDHLKPQSLRQAGIKYFNPDNEDVIMKEPDLRKQAKDIFGIK